MAIIKILKNPKNEAIFKSICTLYQHEQKSDAQNPFFGSLITAVSDNSITFSDGNTYALSEDAQRSETETVFYESGAAWFEKLKIGRRLPAPDSNWAKIRDDIAKSYHKKYFTIEYAVNDTAQTGSCEQECEDLLRVLNSIIVIDSSQDVLEFDNSSMHRETDTYYSAKLRLDATLGGMGSTLPIICRIYYKQLGQEGSYTLKILTKYEAELVHEGIRSNIKKDGTTSGRSITSTLQNQLAEDLDNTTGAKCLTECALFSDASIAAMKEQMDKAKAESEMTQQEIELPLECKKVELISVAKITWPHLSYNVVYKGQNVFGLDYSINGISLSCINCARVQENDIPEMLIENNRICFPANHDLNKKISIYPSDSSGVEDKSENGIKSVIKKYSDELLESNLFKHLTSKPKCNRHIGNKCTRIVCESQLMEPSQKCRDCPYPEVVFMDTTNADPLRDGRRPTSELFFAFDEMKMHARMTDGVKNEHRCPICERRFSSLENEYCALCKKTKIDNLTDNDKGQGKLLYKRYARILHPLTRLRHFFSKKYCFDDDWMLLFVIGKSIYKFDKLFITDQKYLKSAEKIKHLKK